MISNKWINASKSKVHCINKLIRQILQNKQTLNNESMKEELRLDTSFRFTSTSSGGSSGLPTRENPKTEAPLQVLSPHFLPYLTSYLKTNQVNEKQ